MKSNSYPGSNLQYSEGIVDCTGESIQVGASRCRAIPQSHVQSLCLTLNSLPIGLGSVDIASDLSQIVYTTIAHGPNRSPLKYR